MNKCKVLSQELVLTLAKELTVTIEPLSRHYLRDEFEHYKIINSNMFISLVPKKIVENNPNEDHGIALLRDTGSELELLWVVDHTLDGLANALYYAKHHSHH